MSVVTSPYGLWEATWGIRIRGRQTMVEEEKEKDLEERPKVKRRTVYPKRTPSPLAEYDVAEPYGVIDIYDIVKLGLTSPKKAREAGQYYGMQYERRVTREQYLREAYEKGGIYATVKAGKALPPGTAPETVLVLPKGYSPEQWTYITGEQYLRRVYGRAGIYGVVKAGKYVKPEAYYKPPKLGEWPTTQEYEQVARWRLLESSVGRIYEPPEEWRVPEIPRGATIEEVGAGQVKYTVPLTAEELEKAQTEWMADIREQYPEHKYRIEWTPEGALISEYGGALPDTTSLSPDVYLRRGLKAERIKGAITPSLDVYLRRLEVARPKTTAEFLRREYAYGYAQEQLPGAVILSVGPEGISYVPPKEAKELKESYLERGREISKARKGPEPFTLPWLGLSIHKTRVALETFDPIEAGMKIAETVTGREASEEERRLHREIGEYFTGEHLYKKYGVRAGYKAIEEFKYAGTRFIALPESFLLPTPTLGGAIVSTALGRPEEMGRYLGEVEEHPGILLGDITVEYLTGKAIGWVLGKGWGGVKWTGGKVIPEKVKMGWYHRVTVPLKATWQVKVELPVERFVFKSRAYQHLWLEPKIFLKTAFAKPLSKTELQIITRTPWEFYESLYYPFPAKEVLWLKKYLFHRPWMTEQVARATGFRWEWLEKRKALETQLAWTQEPFPAYGIKPKPEYVPLTPPEKLMQAEKVTLARLEKMPRLTYKEGKMTYDLATVGSYPIEKTTAFTYRASLEFEQYTRMMGPSRLYIPKISEKEVASIWKKPPDIKPTPFETTLRKATEQEFGKRMGGLAFTQLTRTISKEFLVQPPSPLTFYKAPVKQYGKQFMSSYKQFISTVTKPKVTPKFIPIMRPTQIVKPKLMLRPLELMKWSRLIQPPRKLELYKQRELFVPKLVQYPLYEEKQRERIVPALRRFVGVYPIQKQKVMQQQGQVLITRLSRIGIFPPSPFPTPPPDIPPYIPPSPPPPIIPPIRRRELEAKKRREAEERRGAWFRRVHPIPGPRQFARQLFGETRKRKKRSRRRRKKK